MVGTLQFWWSQPWSLLVQEAPGRRLLSLMCCIGLLATLPDFTKGAVQEIAVPSYAYPSGVGLSAWAVWKQGATIVIANPDSGPINDSSYQALLSTIKHNSTVTTVLGYVDTDYASKASASVLSEIDLYYQYYPHEIDGIFFDQGSTSCTNTTLAQYKSYDSHVKSKGGLGLTALNWGTIGSECYLNQTNINTYVTFEDYYTNYIAASYSGSPTWVFNHPASKFWHIVHTTPNNQTAIHAAVSLSKTRHAGYIYFTDATYASNPYNKSASPAVWSAEVSGAAATS